MSKETNDRMLAEWERLKLLDGIEQLIGEYGFNNVAGALSSHGLRALGIEGWGLIVDDMARFLRAESVHAIMRKEQAMRGVE